MSCKSSLCLRCAKVYVDNWVSQVSKMLHAGVIYRHIILTVPAMFRTTFYQNAAVLLSAFKEGNFMNCILLMMLGILTLCFHFAFAQGVYERPAVVATVNCKATYHVGKPVLAECRVTSMVASAYEQVCWNVYYPVQCQVDDQNPNAWLGWITLIII